MKEERSPPPPPEGLGVPSGGPRHRPALRWPRVPEAPRVPLRRPRALDSPMAPALLPVAPTQLPTLAAAVPPGLWPSRSLLRSSGSEEGGGMQ